MINQEIIRKRLNKLDEYLDILKNLSNYSFEEFVNDPERYGSTERFLQLAIESIIDIGTHIIADEALGNVNWYSDVPKILAEKGYITSEQSEYWIRMIGFRNVLVHEYVEIDRRIVFDVLNSHLDEISELRRVFAQFL